MITLGLYGERYLLKQNTKLLSFMHYTYKQPVYKQLVHERQIAKKISGINPLSLSNNKNYRLKESWVFPL